MRLAGHRQEPRAGMAGFLHARGGPGQPGKNIRQHAGCEIGFTHADVVRSDHDLFAGIDEAGPFAGIEVFFKNFPEAEHQVRGFHRASRGGGGGSVAIEETGILGMGFVHHALVHGREHKGNPGAGENGKQLRLGTVAFDLKRGYGQRALGFFEVGVDGADGGLYLGRVAFSAGHIGQTPPLHRGALDGHVGVVLRNQKVGRLAEPEGLTDQALHLRHNIVRGDVGADPAARRGEVEKVAIDPVPECVMGDKFLALNPCRRGPDEVEDGNAMGFCAHDTVHGTELAHAVGGGENGGSTAAGIAVGGVGGVELVGADHPLHPAGKLDGVVNREGVVAGNAKGVLDAKVCQTVDDVLGNGLFHKGRFIGSGAADNAGMVVNLAGGLEPAQPGLVPQGVEQALQHLADPAPPVVHAGVDDGPTDADKLRPLRVGNEHIGGTADSAVEPNPKVAILLLHGLADFRKHVDGSDGVKDKAAAVVADIDGVGPGFLALAGVLHTHHTFYGQG